MSKGFVARLTEAGALDPSFGEGGMLTISSLTSLGQLASRPSGYLALATPTEGRTELLTGLDGNGNLDSTFGSFGFRVLGFSEAPALSIAPSGEILLLGRPQRSNTYKKVNKVVEGKKVTRKVSVPIRVQTVQRLLPSGAADRG